MPKHTPGPNAYNPDKFTEASHLYSFGKASRIDEAKFYKSSFAPGPGAYEVIKEDRGSVGYVKPKEDEPLIKRNDADNGVPGPGSYNPKEFYPLPGFRIVPHENLHNDD